MLLTVLNEIQVAAPEEGKVIYWALGILVTLSGAALAYIKNMYKAQLDAKDEQIKYEREEKEKAQQDYKTLVTEFNSIFQQQSLINRPNNG